MTCVRWPRLVAVLTGLVPTVMVAAATPSSAQTDAPAAKPSVRVSPVIVAEPEVETQLAISVGPDSAVPRQTFLRIKGLPLTTRLSEGHVVSPGVWAVPLAGLATLRLTAPLSSSGRSDLTLSLVTVDGNVLNEVRSSLVVAPAWLLGQSGPRPDKLAPLSSQPVGSSQPGTLKPGIETTAAPSLPPEPAATPPAATPPPVQPPVSAQPAAAAPAVVAALPKTAEPAPAVRAPPPPQPASPPAASPLPKAPTAITAEDRARAEGMIQRGDTHLGQGNIAAARQFFRRAADMGHGMAALRLGATFDPFELANRSIMGVQPDPKEAAEWYERARELGIPDAVQRLSRLQTAK